MNAKRSWRGLTLELRALGLGLLLGAGLVCAVLGVYTVLGWFSVQDVHTDSA